MLKIFAAIFLTVTLSCSPLFGQEPVDTTLLLKDTIISQAPPAPKTGFFSKNYPDPKKAGLLSIILPGAGQIYNKDWWKVPLVYGAVGGVVYAIAWNTDLYKRLQAAYQLKLQDKPHEFTGTAIDDQRTLRSLRDEYDKNRQLSYVGLALVYVLNGMEAFVDAHLRHFDISDDLSMRLRPTLNVDPLSGYPSPGIGIRVPLNTARP